MEFRRVNVFKLAWQLDREKVSYDIWCLYGIRRSRSLDDELTCRTRFRGCRDSSAWCVCISCVCIFSCRMCLEGA